MGDAQNRRRRDRCCHCGIRQECTSSESGDSSGRKHQLSNIHYDGILLLNFSPESGYRPSTRVSTLRANAATVSLWLSFYSSAGGTFPSSRSCSSANASHAACIRSYLFRDDSSLACAFAKFDNSFALSSSGLTRAKTSALRASFLRYLVSFTIGAHPSASRADSMGRTSACDLEAAALPLS